MESVFKCLETFYLTEGFDKTYYIAYSGGLDSHVLLHISAKLRASYPLNIKAIHINHNISPHASTWVKHCANICNELQIPFLHKEIQAKHAHGESPEETARDARYTVFADLLLENDYLLTAHHIDDQAETLLLQLLRGAGPKGLAAMPHKKPFAKGFHSRPFLNFSRTELKEYADMHKFSWIDDESNNNVALTRNFLRHEVLPLLKKRWPSVHTTLARVANHCAETQSILESLAQADLHALHEVNTTADKNSFILSIKKLLTLSPERQRQALREWMKQLSMPIPSSIKMQEIQEKFLKARQDKSPLIKWGDVELRRYQHKLYLMKCVAKQDSSKVYQWDLKKPLALGDNRILVVNVVTGFGLRMDIQNVEIRFRQGGEFCRLPGRKNHHDLKKLFQQWKVPPWLRDSIPLVYIENKIAAVIGYFIDESYLAPHSQQGYILNVKHKQ